MVLNVLSILVIIVLFASLIFTLIRKRYDATIGIGLMLAVF